jgi:hypothetical protein
MNYLREIAKQHYTPFFNHNFQAQGGEAKRLAYPEIQSG